MKKITFFTALAVLFFALPNISISQTTPNDQYFLDWNAQWRQAWLDGDVEGIKSMLPADIHLSSSSNYSGQFSSFHHTLTQYVDWVENFYTKEEGRVAEWSPIGLKAANIKVLRSADGGIAWLVEHYRLIQQGNYGKGMQSDTFNITTNYTFQNQDGTWQIVAMFDSYFKIDNTSNWAPLWQWMDAKAWQGKKFRLEAAARTATENQEGAAGIWARVDRASGSVGFFDNMSDRPIRSKEWATYRVEGTIDEDARWFNFGAIQYTPGTGYFDDFKLSVETEPGRWESIPLPNAGFENPDWEDGRPTGWQKTSAFWLNNFQVEQSTERPFAGKYALKVTGTK